MITSESRQRWSTLVVAALIVAVAAPVRAQEEAEKAGESAREAPHWEQAFEEAMGEGRQAYNDNDWDRAVDRFVRAIQIRPDRPEGYRNLARSYNQQEMLERATVYYDDYLEMAGDAGDAEQIRAERRGAIARGGDDPWTIPADQRMARRALQRELREGRAMTEGGGAWKMYQTLLDVDYARPDLQELRERLETKMFDEFEENLERDGGFLPVATAEDWALQRRRLEGIEKLTRSPERLESLRPRYALVEAAEALLDGNFERAADRAEIARREFEFAGWYRVVALREMERIEEALALLDELVADGVFEGESRSRVRVVRAILLREDGRPEEAAGIFEDVLGD